MQFPQSSLTHLVRTDAEIILQDTDSTLTIGERIFKIDSITLEFYLYENGHKVVRNPLTDLSSHDPSEFEVEPTLYISEISNNANVYDVGFRIIS